MPAKTKQNRNPRIATTASVKAFLAQRLHGLNEVQRIIADEYLERGHVSSQFLSRQGISAGNAGREMREVGLYFVERIEKGRSRMKMDFLKQKPRKAETHFCGLPKDSWKKCYSRCHAAASCEAALAVRQPARPDYNIRGENRLININPNLKGITR